MLASVLINSANSPRGQPFVYANILSTDRKSAALYAWLAYCSATFIKYSTPVGSLLVAAMIRGSVGWGNGTVALFVGPDEGIGLVHSTMARVRRYCVLVTVLMFQCCS